MSAIPATPPGPSLCHGLKIEYKAYARHFLENEDAVLYLIATCYYGHNGFTVYFEEAGENRFQLMEQPPSGVFLNVLTYYVASWPPPTGVSAERPVSAARHDSGCVRRAPN
jgi:hypothetical protein